jgi:hypothetical protein
MQNKRPVVDHSKIVCVLIQFENIFGSGPDQIPVEAVIYSATLSYTFSMAETTPT